MPIAGADRLAGHGALEPLEGRGRAQARAPPRRRLWPAPWMESRWCFCCRRRGPTAPERVHAERAALLPTTSPDNFLQLTGFTPRPSVLHLYHRLVRSLFLVCPAVYIVPSTAYRHTHTHTTALQGPARRHRPRPAGRRSTARARTHRDTQWRSKGATSLRMTMQSRAGSSSM